MVADKFEKLRAALRSYGSCIVAYSGGVDSVFLAHVAHEVLGEKSLAVIADSPSLPRRELAEALQLGKQFNFPVRVVKTAEFNNPSYLANPLNRCYFCKHELFDELTPLAKAENFAVVCYGENASDTGDFRPGAKAASEFHVRAPMKEAGLTKSEIRELSAQMGLPTADKPQMACLSSRIPTGEAVSPEKLRMIEEAEYVLRDLGFYDVRVRHHELGGQSNQSKVQSLKSKVTEPATNNALRGLETLDLRPETQKTHLARIEVGPAELPKLLADGVAARVAEAIKKLGYAHVTVDLQGYRRGSLNEQNGSRTTHHASQEAQA